MARSLRDVMIGKSEEGLTEYLNNFNKYTPKAIKAAFDELKRRGGSFSENELNEINQKIQNRTKAENEEDTLFPSDGWKQNLVRDPNAPLLYSKGAIRAFSVMFSTIFGAILLSYNINDSKKKWIVISFGIVYTAVTILILKIIPLTPFYTLMLNTAGGLGLTSTFWSMYVGQDIKYRAKPILKPLIISIIILIPFLLAIIYGEDL